MADASAAAGVVVERVLGAVVVAAELRGDVDAVGWRPGQLRAQYLLHVLGEVAAEDAAVELVARLRAQRIAPQIQRIAQLHAAAQVDRAVRSEEHTSELQSLMRISYAAFCLKKTTKI